MWHRSCDQRIKLYRLELLTKIALLVNAMESELKTWKRRPLDWFWRKLLGNYLDIRELPVWHLELLTKLELRWKLGMRQEFQNWSLDTGTGFVLGKAYRGYLDWLVWPVRKLFNNLSTIYSGCFGDWCQFLQWCLVRSCEPLCEIWFQSK